MLTKYAVYLFIMNVISLIEMAFDKRKAIRNKSRISESFFTVFSVLGGFFGILLGGRVFRHKTKKRSFQLKIILGTMLHLLIIFYLMNYYF